MSETQVLAIAGAILAAMFGLLTTIIAWIGARAIASIDALRDKFADVASDLHDKISVIDNRLTKVETKMTWDARYNEDRHR